MDLLLLLLLLILLVLLISSIIQLVVAINYISTAISVQLHRIPIFRTINHYTQYTTTILF